MERRLDGGGKFKNAKDGVVLCMTVERLRRRVNGEASKCTKGDGFVYDLKGCHRKGRSKWFAKLREEILLKDWVIFIHYRGVDLSTFATLLMVTPA